MMVDVAVTYFDDRTATHKSERVVPLDELALQIQNANATAKEKLKWLKLACFGDERSEKGSLRFDANVVSCSGLEIDYDAGVVPLEAVIGKLKQAGVLALVYTSPSYLPDDPRCRVLCPFSHPLPPSERAKMVSRVNGVLGGIAARESWTLSQAFYFGAVNGNRYHRVEIIPGTPVDELDALDEIAIGPPLPEQSNGSDATAERDGFVDEHALLEHIRRGHSYHVPTAQLAGLWAHRGVPLDFAKTRIRDAFFATPPEQRDDRWQARFGDIERTVGDIYTKDASNFQEEPARPWPCIAEDAFYGLAGDIVRAFDPHTEADPVGILTQILAAAGNAMGRYAYYQVEGDRHYPNVYIVEVGPTAKGRKGTSAGRVRQIMQIADPVWAGDCVKSGLSSGEGLIWQIRDEIRGFQGKGTDRTEAVIDPGIADKRILIKEAEFANALAVMKRQGNTLSPIVREGWESGVLQSLTKNSQARATGAHLSIVGHISAEELRRELDQTSIANGFANRFLYCCVNRSKALPFGGNIDDAVVGELGTRMKNAIIAAQGVGKVEMTPEAAEAWKTIYEPLSEGEPGMVGAIIGRAEAQVIRLSLIYCLLEGCDRIDLPHLRAGLAVWDYCDESARFIFGDLLGDPVADAILNALRASPTGLTRTQIRDLFTRNHNSTRIDAALAMLKQRGKAQPVPHQTGGRPAEVWIAIRR